MNLKEIILSLRKNQALLHYNVSSFEQIKAGILAVKETKIPLIFGVSEGERDYLGEELIKEIVDFYKKKKNLPLFLNADHSKKIDSAQRAIDIGYDSVLFDGSEYSFEENIKITNELVNYRGDKDILIEGEIGYLPGKSDIQKEIEVKDNFLTQPEEALDFVQKTKVDLLAVSIGNFHGVTGSEPILDFNRGEKIYQLVKIPLVLHGGSGISSENLKKAITSGFKIIHLNTEFRLIWKEKLKERLTEETVVPYKILPQVVEEIKNKIIYYQKIFFKD